MASYGTFSSTIKNHYNKVNYTLDNTTYSEISIFKTNPKTESIAPAVYLKGNKQLMENMTLPHISATKVIAKTNAGSMQYGGEANKDAFYGLYYVNGTLYKDNKKMTGTSDSNLDDLHSRYFPCFCIKKDGTANIRWPKKADLPTMLTYCDAVIGALEPLVYTSKSVFEYVLYDDANVRISNIQNFEDKNCRYVDSYCGTTTDDPQNRTLLGHHPDGSYFMVCAASAQMTLRVAAKLMIALGCDYAVNLDGSAAVRMRVASAYQNGYKPIDGTGRMTYASKDQYYGAAVCAYLK